MSLSSSTKPAATAAARALVLALFAVVGLFAGLAAPAWGAFGEDFRAVPVNSGAGSPDVAALAGVSDAWWAGTCDRAAAPDPPADLGPLGGIGTLPGSVQSPNGNPVPVEVAAPARPMHCIDWRFGSVPGQPNPLSYWNFGAPGWRLPAVASAGSHPDGSATFAVLSSLGDLDNIYVDLPAGFVGDPNAVVKCSAAEFAVKPQQCPPSSQVGVLSIWLQCAAGCNQGLGVGDVEHVPVYNLEPREGNTAELGLVRLSSEGQVTARLVAKARTNGDFGVTTFTGQIPSALPLSGQAITIWGVPWAAHNDIWRAPQGLGRGISGCNDQPGAAGSRILPPSGLPDVPGCRVSWDSSWGAVKPFLSLETGCNSGPSTQLALDTYQFPGPFSSEGDPIVSGHPQAGHWKTYQSPAPPVVGCESLGFAPDIDFAATDGRADGPSGLHAELAVPQNDVARGAGGQPLDIDDGDYLDDATGYWASDAGRASAHLRDTVVRLPAGLAINPSLATGLVACTDAQIGLRQLGNPPLFNNGDPFNKDGGADGAECPDGSKLGTVEVDTPLLDEQLTGEMVLGQPKSTDPQSGEMLRVFLVLRSKARGLVAKIYGSSTADPTNGQIVARFLRNPQVPFDRLRVRLQGGERGVFGLPQRCGAHGWSTTFVPWSSGPDVGDGGAVGVGARCSFGFAPSQSAGMDTQRPRGFGSFSFDFSRADGDQWLAGLEAKLPRGLLGSVRGVPLCTGAQAAAGACPPGSKIGSVDATAGAGTPFRIEQPGEVFLTDGYKGCPYGLLVKVRAIAGPFRGPLELSPVLVRQAVCVDRRSAQVTAVSDPLPLIHHGVPLRVRRVTVHVDRTRFMLNPSGCAAKRIRGSYTGNGSAAADRINGFQAAGCGRLPFRPRMAMRLVGRRQMTTGRHPAIRTVVRQAGVGEAGIRRAQVRLPKSLALDVDNAQALCEHADGTKPDLENHCPAGSIVGRARAISPLLNAPLVGNVYFVKNIRTDPNTGNTIRTLPMLIVALRGEIAINLQGNSNVRNGRLISTFANTPDAPINRFNINIKGGNNGILAVTRTRQRLINLCKSRPQRTATNLTAHNNKRHNPQITLQTPCPKKKSGQKRRGNRRA